MGMYTGVRARIVVKPEYLPLIQAVVNRDEPNSEQAWNAWDAANQFSNTHDLFITAWSNIGRSSFIPFGGLSYMPDEWDGLDHKTLKQHPDPQWECRLDGNLWIFQCSLKNYQGEIECFMTNVLPLISDYVQHFEMYYEEWEFSRMYKLEDGVVSYAGLGKEYQDWDESRRAPMGVNPDAWEKQRKERRRKDAEEGYAKHAFHSVNNNGDNRWGAHWLEAMEKAQA